MITLYIGRENLPSDKVFIEDVEDLILAVEICSTDFQCRVLEEVEHGKYYDNSRFIDRF